MASKLELLNVMFAAIEKQKTLLRTVDHAEKLADDSIEFIFGKLRSKIASISELERTQERLQILIENQQKLKERLNEVISGVNIPEQYYKVLMNGSFEDNSHLILMQEAITRLDEAIHPLSLTEKFNLRAVKERQAHCARILEAFWKRFFEFLTKEIHRLHQIQSNAYLLKKDLLSIHSHTLFSDGILKKYSSLLQKLFEKEPRLHREIEEVYIKCEGELYIIASELWMDSVRVIWPLKKPSDEALARSGGIAKFAKDEIVPSLAVFYEFPASSLLNESSSAKEGKMEQDPLAQVYIQTLKIWSSLDIPEREFLDSWLIAPESLQFQRIEAIMTRLLGTWHIAAEELGEAVMSSGSFRTIILSLLYLEQISKTDKIGSKRESLMAHSLQLFFTQQAKAISRYLPSCRKRTGMNGPLCAINNMIYWSLALFRQEDFTLFRKDSPLGIPKKQKSVTNTEVIVRKGICSLLKIILSQIQNLPRSATTEKEKRNASVYQLENGNFLLYLIAIDDYWVIQDENKEDIISSVRELLAEVTNKYVKGCVGQILKGSENISASSPTTVIAKLLSGWSLRDIRNWSEDVRARVIKHFSASRKLLPVLVLEVWKEIEKETIHTFQQLSDQIGKRISSFNKEELTTILRDAQKKD